MNIYALFPLIATLVFIPLIVTTMASRPWQRQQKLFFLFIIPAMLWSLTDYFWRSNFFPQYSLLLSRFVLVFFTSMAVQFHFFSSSFFPTGANRWLPLAYGTLAIIIIMAALGYFPESVYSSGDTLSLVSG